MLSDGRRFWLIGLILALISFSCTLEQIAASDPQFAPATTSPLLQSPEPPASPTTRLPASPTVPLPTSPLPQLSASPTSPPPTPLTPLLYYTQAGDTLPVVAVRFGVDAASITSPDPLPATTLLNPGQLLIIPQRLANTTSPKHLLPDSEVVFSPSATDFDIHSFVVQANGYLNAYAQWLPSTGVTSGADVLARVALENSINPRLLLALLEYESGWVYGAPVDLSHEEYPMGKVNESLKRLYHQLSWAVNQLSIGYYGDRKSVV